MNSPQNQQSRKPSGETGTVICKIPQGMILHLHKKEKITEATPSGSRDTVRHFQDEDAGTVRIFGPAHAQNEGPRQRQVGGFALTENVSKDFFERWLEETGKYLPAVRNGLIQFFPNTDKAVGGAREFKKQKSGLERIDPENLPGGGSVKQAEEQIAKIQHIAE